MKKIRITNLVLGAVAIIGTCYVTQKHIKNKKNNKIITKSMNDFVSTNKETDDSRTYYTIGKTVLDDNNCVIKSVNDSSKQMKKIM